ncbi:2-thiouracil desulfurase family protein [Helicovermis profundi]|uniref:DUF523 domain-containing protein n=1 Tax=Helicovermis profundi TaxID=3065157 RepID=A0AAU9EKT8_9FIRM|nr:DUF523 domain-containing protein [Clostridia bacterium S502]
MILVSACLLGINCKYNGENNKNQKVIDYVLGKKFLPICPEQLGGLTTPRLPAEIIGDKVFLTNGEDVTSKFEKGSLEIMKYTELLPIDFAILKDGSPSCGSEFVYDGNFTGTKIKGEGITTEELRKKGVKVINENNL